MSLVAGQLIDTRTGTFWEIVLRVDMGGGGGGVCVLGHFRV